MAAGGAVAATTTERPARPREPAAEAPARSAPRRKPPSFGVFAGSLATFFALLAFLAVQVRAGGDPALGPAKPAPTAEPRRVIVHRVIVRTVVLTERAPGAAAGGLPAESAVAGGAPPERAAAGGGPAESAAGGGASAQSAPAAPAQAPAPAAPVATGTS